MGSQLDVIDVDALVVGAGAGGIYATYRLSRAGLIVKCIDVASDVGGTWYWNRYPGAMSDTQSYLYRYSWDKEDLQTYPWSRHYVYQPEILEYFRHVVKKHDLRKYMSFNTEMNSATWDEKTATWAISCSGGLTTIRARYLVNCLGILSKPNYPDIAGISSFAGKAVHTAEWEDVDLEGKTVGIIGNGSTGVQVMTALAPTVGRLVSFQRSPQYSVPSAQGPVTPEYRAEVNANYDTIWQNVFASVGGFGVPETTRKTMEATPEERRQAFQEVWDQGNAFRFMLSAFGDITTDEDANEEACKFIRSKIDEIVHDPKKAAALKPRDPYARRPLCDAGYYQIFNRDNVDIVDLRETPIDRIVPEGIATKDGKVHQLDVLIFATGFDAIEGNYLSLRINGRGGQDLNDHWESGPTSCAGVACPGFPNMYMVAGPQGPFANYPPLLESEMDFIMQCIELTEKREDRVLEVSADAEKEWGKLCDKMCEGSLFKKTSSWLFGTNVKGRKQRTKFLFGGIVTYREWTRNEVDAGFPSFVGRAETWDNVGNTPKL